MCYFNVYVQNGYRCNIIFNKCIDNLTRCMALFWNVECQNELDTQVQAFEIGSDREMFYCFPFGYAKRIVLLFFFDVKQSLRTRSTKYL
jgi:hypothetical protein